MTEWNHSVLVALPCRDTIPTATAKSIAATVKAGYDVVFSTGGGLPNARNEIARATLAQGYEAVLMIDSDMVWLPEHVSALTGFARDSACSIVSGRYHSRSAPHHVHAYRNGKPFHGGENPSKTDHFPVDYTGAGFLLVEKRVFERVPEPWFDHSYKQGEDAYFCHKAKEHNFTTILYPWVTVGHVGTTMYSDPQYEKVLQ